MKKKLLNNINRILLNSITPCRWISSVSLAIVGIMATIAAAHAADPIGLVYNRTLPVPKGYEKTTRTIPPPLPSGVAINESGQIIVSEELRCTLRVYNPNDRFFTFKDMCGEELPSLQAVATDSENRMLLAAGSSVVIYGQDGSKMSVLGSHGEENGQFLSVTTVETDSQDRIIVGDSGQNRVQIFDKFGNFLSAFGSSGSEPGQFMGIARVAVNSRDEILVTDIDNCRVQVFDSQGNFLTSFGSCGEDNQAGEFDFIYGIAVDSSDRVVVSDAHNNTLSVFERNADGIYNLSFVYDGTGDVFENGTLYYVRDLEFTANDQLVVVSSYNMDVNVFDYLY